MYTKIEQCILSCKPFSLEWICAGYLEISTNDSLIFIPLLYDMDNSRRSFPSRQRSNNELVLFFFLYYRSLILVQVL